MSAEPDQSAKKPKVNLAKSVQAATSFTLASHIDNRCSDPSGAEHREQDETATAILKKKKKPNSLMYVLRRLSPSAENMSNMSPV
jgi:transitional endoplasmic reticulum ATPase